MLGLYQWNQLLDLLRCELSDNQCDNHALLRLHVEVLREFIQCLCSLPLFMPVLHEWNNNWMFNLLSYGSQKPIEFGEM